MDSTDPYQDRKRSGGRFSQEREPDQLTRVGELLEPARIEHGWSYEEVSRRAGVKSRSTWGDVIYGGHNVRGEFKPVKSSADILTKFALALGVNVPEALKAAGYQEPPTYDPILTHVPASQLCDELRHRGVRAGLVKQVEAELHGKKKRHAGT